MIKIAICDDSKYLRGIARASLLKYFFDKNYEYAVDEYESGEKLISANEKYDLILLDYQFEDKGVDGLTIARQIRKFDAEVTIIFLSSYTNIVFDTFEVEAFRFLVKPIDEGKLHQALDDFLTSFSKDNSIVVRSEGVNYNINDKEISYVEADGKNAVIHFIGEKKLPIVCHKTLSEIEQELQANYFFRCHRSYIIGLRHVSSYCSAEIELTDGSKINIGRNKYKPFLQAYAENRFVVRGM